MKNYLLFTLIFFVFIFFPNFLLGEESTWMLFKFIENKGQWNDNILYRADINSGTLFLEKNCFTYSFYDNSALAKMHLGEILPESEWKIRYHALKVNFRNSSAEVKVSGSEPSSEYYNYFLGNDKSKWVSGAKPFTKVSYNNIYEGIDLNLYTDKGLMKYDFVISPNGNPEEIILNYNGPEKIFIRNDALIIKTSVNEIIEQKPFAYQIINGKKIEVKCEFVLTPLSGEGLGVGFSLGSCDKSLPLIIDPILIFASYSGSTADNFGMTATYDNAGNFYAGGMAFGSGYPTTVGAYDVSFNNITTGTTITDVVITKYNSSGNNLIYSTYLGGNGTESVHSLIVNENDELFLYGVTSSTDFPVSSNAYDTGFGGGIAITFPQNGAGFSTGTDIYVTKFNAAGSALLGSTYIGGSANDGVNYNNNTALYDSLQFNYGDQFRGEIMTDNAGNCYVASSTKSSDFPMVNGFQDTLNGDQDGVIIKFNQDLSTLLWSTYLGGTNKDAAYSVKVDSSYNVYVAGGTTSPDFPVDTILLNPTYLGGKTDGYVAKISNDGSQLLRATFIGTNAYDQCYFVELDNDTNVYLVGQTLGSFPVSTGVYSNANSPQFIIKLNNSLDSIIYSTVFGNGSLSKVNISPAAFLVDDCENVYVSGWGASILQGTPLNGMPVTSDALFPNSPNGFDFYLFVLSRNASSLLYATYFGGGQSREHVDGGTSRFDKRGVVYQSVCAGCGGNDDFPTTSGAWSNVNNGVSPTGNPNCNNGTFKFDFQILPFASLISTSSECDSCTGTAIISASGGISPYSYQWDSLLGNSTSSTLSGLCEGNYEVTITDSVGCSSEQSISIPAALVLTISSSQNLSCAGSCNGQVTINAAGGSSPYSYQWNNSSTSETLTGLCAGTYSATVTDANLCEGILIYSFTDPSPLSFLSSSQTDILCNGDSSGQISVTVNGGTAPYSFLWNNSSVSSQISNLTSQTYSVTITDTNGCALDTSFNILQPAALVLTMNSTNESCYDLCNGTATVSVTGGVSSYSYLWSDNSISSSLDSLCSGTYLLSVTDGNNCLEVDSVFVNTTDFQCSFSVVDNSNCQSCNGSAMVSANGGSSPYNYSWSDASVTPSITGLCAGAYSVTVSDSTGCDTVNFFLINDPANINLVLSGSDDLKCFEVCNGEAIAGVSGGEAPYVFLWSTGENTSTISGLCAGTYVLSVTDSNECKGFLSVEISEPSLLLISNLAFAEIDCYGNCNGSATVNISGGTMPYSYLWSNSQTGFSINNLCTGNYSVTITDSNNCAVDTVLVISEPVPLQSATASGPQSCYPDCDGTASVAVSGGTSSYSYLWSDNSITALTTGLCPGTYFITVTDGNNCEKIDSASVAPSNFQSFLSGVDNGNCQNCNGTASVSPSGGITPYSYLWDDSSITSSLTGLCGGTYSVTVSDSTGCDTVASILINNPSDMELFLADSNNLLCNGICIGEAITSVSGGSGPFTYLWSSGQTTSSISGLCAGTYVLTVTDSSDCKKFLSVEISEPPLLLISSLASTDIDCYGNCNALATVNISGGTTPYSYLWNNSQTGFSINNLCTGNYSVTVTDSNNCPADSGLTISQPPLLQSTTVGISQVCFLNCDGYASVSSSGGTPGYAYSWSNGTTSSTATGLCPGNYYITITDANGCTGIDSTLVDSSAFQRQTLLLTSDTSTLFEGESTVLHAVFDDSANYHWSPPEGLSNINSANPVAAPISSTTYFFTVSSPFDPKCSYSDSIAIFVIEEVCGEPDIFVPNAFTPNNDNQNDYVFVRGNYIRKMHFIIYDRWGEKIFETENQDDGWDGTFKGMKCDPAVFVYYLAVTCNNEQEFFKKGNITLIR